MGSCIVYKINPSTMSEVASFDATLAVPPFFGNTIIHCLVLAGGYLYVGTSSDDVGILIKINPSDMSLVDSWNEAGRSVRALDFDGTYLLVSINTSPATIVRINPATMLEVDRWQDLDLYPTDIRGITHDGTYYYAISFTDSAVLTIDPATMTTINGALCVTEPWQIIYNGGYLYICGEYVSKVDPATLTEVDSWTNTEPGPVRAVEKSGAFLYAGIESAPGEVVQIKAGALSKSFIPVI